MSRSVQRITKILNLVAESNGDLRHSHIGQELDIPKGSLTKLLKSLVEEELLNFDQYKKTYTIGPHVLYLANAYFSRIDIIRLAKPIVKKIMLTTNESTTLNIIKGDKGLVVCQQSSPQTLMPKITLGDHLPLYATSGGKALLAYLPKERIEQYLANVELKPLTSNTISNPDELLRELKKIRSRGISISNGEHFEDLKGFATPIFGWDGHIVASLTTAIPIARNTPEKEKKIKEMLLTSSAEISEKLGKV